MLLHNKLDMPQLKFSVLPHRLLIRTQSQLFRTGARPACFVLLFPGVMVILFLCMSHARAHVHVARVVAVLEAWCNMYAAVFW